MPDAHAEPCQHALTTSREHATFHSLAAVTAHEKRSQRFAAIELAPRCFSGQLEREVRAAIDASTGLDHPALMTSAAHP